MIASHSLAPLLAEAKGERKESPFLYHATNRVKDSRLHDSGEPALYRGHDDDWQTQFAISQPGTRRNQLKALLHHIFRQVGREVARRNAEAQHREANPAPSATLAEHLEECDAVWSWTVDRWRSQLSETECVLFDALHTETERDTFRIARSFARKAELDDVRDFPFPVEHVGARLGVSYQAVGKLRKRFIELGILENTAPAIINRCAARFQWLPRLGADEPF